MPLDLYRQASRKIFNAKRKKQRQERHLKPKGERVRGRGVIIKTVFSSDRGGRVNVPRESENLCLFTGIAIHFYEKKFPSHIAILSRCLYALYKTRIEFCKSKLQKALETITQKKSRATLFKLMGAYVGKSHLRKSRDPLFSVVKRLLRECNGHPLNDLIDVENFFDLRIRLYTKGGAHNFYTGDTDNDDDDSVNDSASELSQPLAPAPPILKPTHQQFVKCLFPAGRNSGEVVNLHVNDSLTHVDYIVDLNRFGNQFICTKCDQNFSELRSCRVHEAKCGVTENYKYVGGVFNPRKTVFERLQENEIFVPPGLEFLEYFIVFDFESLLVAIQGKDKDENGTYEEHIPISVGVGSNLDSETRKGFFLCNRDPLQLIREFVELLLQLSDRIYSTVKPKYQMFFDALEEKIAATTLERNVKEAGILKKLYNDLHNLIRRAIVLSFNGSKYDVVLILAYFFQIYKEMGNFNGEVKDFYKDGTLRSDIFVNILQRGSQIMSLITEKLSFKDLALFLAPGCSYKKYLKNFSCHLEKLEKLVFPYKKAKSFDCLYSREFPTFHDFWDDLRQDIGISEQQYSDFVRAWRDPKNPNLIRDGCCLIDILREYNMADVNPLVRAVEKHMSIYKNELDVDLFFEYISLPSVGLKWMFKNEKEKFYTFPQSYGFLHRQIQNGRTGGLCTVFHRKVVVGGEMRRYYEKGGPVLETPKICRAISIIDATSLYPAMYYLYDFYVGAPIYRRPPFYRPERVGIDHGVSAESHTWLRFCERKYGVKIISGHNTGEVCVSSRNYRVDGYTPPTKMGDRGIVFQYDSCKYHAHECAENNFDAMGADLPPSERKIFISKLKKDGEIRRGRTHRIRKFLQDEGYDVVSINSCEWAKRQKEKPVRDILLETGGEGCTLYPKSCLPKDGVTTSEIIKKVKMGLFHGLLKVDIYLDEPWKTKYEFFPFFCQNQLVSKSCLSEEMQKVCDANGALKRPAKQLVSCSNAKSIILTSELLKWYLHHHAKVDNLHWCLEYRKAPVFRDKIEKMAEWRRASISDKNLEAQAQAAKLLSNSSIGKTGEDVSRHTNTNVCGTSQVHKYVSSSRFIDATPIPSPKEAGQFSSNLQSRSMFRDLIGEVDGIEFEDGGFFNRDEGENQLYLVHTDKRNYVFRTPSIIQFTVYNHAKMHMLTMAIDVILEFTLPGSVAIAYTDTDSFCLSISFPSLDEAIDPLKRENYFTNVRHHWFPQEWCKNHFQAYLNCKIAGRAWDYESCKDCKDKFQKEFYTPGIFKVEQNGDRAIFLSPKLYVLEDTKTGAVKSGSKGISQRCNKLTFDMLDEQLTKSSPEPTPTMNYQFTRNKCGGVGTSKLKKFSISKIYTKRRTMVDNVNTLPLFRPKKEGNYDIVQQAYEDDDDSNSDRDKLVEKILSILEDEVTDHLMKSAIRDYLKDPSISSTPLTPTLPPPK